MAASLPAPRAVVRARLALAAALALTRPSQCGTACFPANQNATTSMACSGNGDCSAEGTCACFRGFSGALCGAPVCVPLDGPTAQPVSITPLLSSPSCSGAVLRGEKVTCCNSQQDVASAMLALSLANRSAGAPCPSVWAQLGCNSMCDPRQGQWLSWRVGWASLPRPTIDPVASNDSLTQSGRWVSGMRRCGGNGPYPNVTCCAAIQRATTAVKSPRCAEILLSLLYASHCGAGSVPLCSNFSRTLYSACADEESFGYNQPVRMVFGNAKDFVRNLLPAQLAAGLVFGDGSSVEATCQAPPQVNTTWLPPWQVCIDQPVGREVDEHGRATFLWRNNLDQVCSDFEEQQLCTSSGDYGVGWVPQWGTFESSDFIDANGVTATEACCACGGGMYPAAPEPEPEPLEPEPEPLLSRIAWHELLAPTGLEYAVLNKNTTIDNLHLNICSWFCGAEAAGSCDSNGENFGSICDESPVGWLKVHRTDSDCFARCLNDCSARGSCYNASTRAFAPTCTCNNSSLYYGDDCSFMYCPLDCSGRGTCHSTNGSCACDHGYGGSGCEMELCPNACGGFGSCNAETTICTCVAGRQGSACELYTCPDDCSGVGVCDIRNGQCSCEDGRHGANCAQHQFQIYDIIPSLGPITGSTVLIVHGAHFLDARVNCRFEPRHGMAGSYGATTSITEATIINSSAISCATPAQSRAEVLSVRVIGSSESNTRPFRFYKPPALQQVTPYYGPMAGGAEVVVLGSYGWLSVGDGFMPTGASAPDSSIAAEVDCTSWSSGLFAPCGTSCVPRIDCPNAQSLLRCKFTTFGVGGTELSKVVSATIGSDLGLYCTAPSGGGTAVVAVSLNGQQFSDDAPAASGASLGYIYMQPGSSFTVATYSSLSPAIIEGAKVGQSVQFTILAKDQNGDVSLSGEAADFTVAYLGGASGASPSIVDAGGGSYTASFIPYTSGAVELSITTAGYHVVGSPYTVVVAPAAADPLRCVFTGPSLLWDAENAGEASYDLFETTLYMRDGYNNPTGVDNADTRLTFTLLATEVLAGSVEGMKLMDQSMLLTAVEAPSILANSTFIFQLQSHMIGEHTLSVELDDARIAGRLYGFTTKPARAVVVTSAHFSIRGEVIFVGFSRASDRAAGITPGMGVAAVADTAATEATCQAVFDQSTVISLGHQAKCQWQTNHNLTVNLGAGTLLIPGSNLTLKSNAIYSLLQNSLAAAGAFTVHLPLTSPLVPRAVIDAPSVVGKCSDWVLSGANSVLDDPLRRPLRYRWQLEYGRSSSALQNKLEIASIGMGQGTLAMNRYDLANDMHYAF